ATSASLHRNDSELGENPKDWVGDPVGADAASRDPVVLRRRLAESGYSEIAVAAIVQLSDLVDPGSLPPGQQPLDLGVYLQAVALVEVRLLGRRPEQRACILQVVHERVHLGEHDGQR